MGGQVIRRLVMLGGALLVLALGLDWALEQRAAPVAPGGGNAPDVYMLDARISQYDDQGRLAYSTQAERFTHYPLTEIITMAKPEVRLAGETAGQGWELSATDGRILPGSPYRDELLELWGNVLAEKPGAADEASAGKDAPIRIRAQAAVVNAATGVSTYEGEVVITQGGLWVTADTVEVRTLQQQVVQAVAAAEPEGGRLAQYRQEPSAGGDGVQAQARTITYLVQAEEVQLAGQARLAQGGQVFTGEILRYDLRAGQVQLDAGGEPGGRVRLEMAPKDG